MRKYVHLNFFVSEPIERIWIKFTVGVYTSSYIGT